MKNYKNGLLTLVAILCLTHRGTVDMMNLIWGLEIPQIGGTIVRRHRLSMNIFDILP